VRYDIYIYDNRRLRVKNSSSFMGVNVHSVMVMWFCGFWVRAEMCECMLLKSCMFI
jgi:hypothetical protein